MAAANTRRLIHNVELKIRSPDYPDLIFLRAEVNGGQITPFALVWYAIQDHERATPLRLDIDKRKFLDLADLENSDFQRVADALAPRIAEQVAIELLKWFASPRP